MRDSAAGAVRNGAAGAAMLWCCPRCRGDLAADGERLRCRACHSGYDRVAGIPDLRLPGPSWIDFAEDLAFARELAAGSGALPLEKLVERVYAARPGWDQARIDKRTRQVVGGPDRLRGDVSGWLSQAIRPGGRFLDIGCGGGMLLAAAATAGRRDGIGIDVSMTWLVVAARMIAEHGGTPVLAAALGEALPLRDGAVDAVVSLDVIEHVADPDGYLREVDRVTAPGGTIALSTPNRFSLTAEPHVFVWGVGWLPRPWQRGFVRWRSGKSYDDTRLMSSRELVRRVRGNTRLRFSVVIPPVPAEEIARFRPIKARLARLYNRIHDIPWMRAAFLLVGPFFRVVGVKR